MSSAERLRTLICSAAAAGALVLSAVSGAAADEIYADQWNELHDVTLQAMGADQLDGVVGESFEFAWQSVDIPAEEDLTPEQKAELEQLRTGNVIYQYAENGDPIYGPTAFGGTDNLVSTLSGDQGIGSQIQGSLLDGMTQAGLISDGFDVPQP